MSSTLLRCRILGHDWDYQEEEKVCVRCDRTEPNDRERQDEDPEAEPGDVRFSVEQVDNDRYRVEVEHYKMTAWGKESEYYQWFPSSVTMVSEDGLVQLMGESIEALGIEEDIEEAYDG